MLMKSTDKYLSKAESAFKDYRNTSPAQRASFLRSIAENIESLGDRLIQVLHEETNLPKGRLEGERGRTCNQLRLFASFLEEGSWVEAVIETAIPDRLPLPRPDLRRMLIPVGPVLVFGASNFPLAFSTAGGDTASALASGCPVVFKGHPAHPRTSTMVSEAILQAVKEYDLPDGVFTHLEGGTTLGQELVKHPVIKAIAFTGSFVGGMAIFKTAMERPEPIPVYAEMGSVNPVFVLPGKIENNPAGLGQNIAKSVLLGAGQFCTNPGLVFIPESESTSLFIDAMKKEFSESPEEKMLHEKISVGYFDALGSVLAQHGVESIVARNAEVPYGPPSLGYTSLENWVKNPHLHEEVFGPFTLLVRYKDATQLETAVQHLQGQLTCSIHGTKDELLAHRTLIESVSEKCGRILFDGVPTGVEVGHSMTHGGPFPATTDSRSTSVGTAAIKRFLRPITYQSAPEEILPDALKSHNTGRILRYVNGEYTRESL